MDDGFFVDGESLLAAAKYIQDKINDGYSIEEFYDEFIELICEFNKTEIYDKIFKLKIPALFKTTFMNMFSIGGIPQDMDVSLTNNIKQIIDDIVLKVDLSEIQNETILDELKKMKLRILI